MEQNASDTRNKKTIEMQVSGLLINQRVSKFFKTNDKGKLYFQFIIKMLRTKKI